MHSFILAAREREKHSACCVRNDRSGCVQTSKEECSVGVLQLGLCCLLLISDLGLMEFFTGFLAMCGSSHPCPSLPVSVEDAHLTNLVFIWTRSLQHTFALYLKYLIFLHQFRARCGSAGQ